MAFRALEGTPHAPYAYRVLSDDFPAAGATVVEYRFNLATSSFHADVRTVAGRLLVDGRDFGVDERTVRSIDTGRRSLDRDAAVAIAEEL